MQVSMVKAGPARLEDCVRIFEDSALYDHYFSGSGRLREVLADAIEKNQLYLVLNSKGEAIGGMQVDLKGFFGFFPYLSLLGVRKDFRGMGIGHMLLGAFEGIAKELGYSKVSLLVSQFNPRARALYQGFGYRKIGFLENALMEGVNENIMVKSI